MDPIKVLIVEDDPASLVVLEYLVETLSFIPLTATDVASARTILAENNPDIAILDLMLPDGDGCDVMAEIRKGNRPIAVALLTGTHERPKIYKCEAWKPDAMFMKPLDPALLGDWLGRQMARIKLKTYMLPTG